MFQGEFKEISKIAVELVDQIWKQIPPNVTMDVVAWIKCVEKAASATLRTVLMQIARNAEARLCHLWNSADSLKFERRNSCER